MMTFELETIAQLIFNSIMICRSYRAQKNKISLFCRPLGERTGSAVDMRVSNYRMQCRKPQLYTMLGQLCYFFMICIYVSVILIFTPIQLLNIIIIVRPFYHQFFIATFLQPVTQLSPRKQQIEHAQIHKHMISSRGANNTLSSEVTVYTFANVMISAK